jgi:response regulator RpfG family c-di-GMP phosphodiesterase
VSQSSVRYRILIVDDDAHNLDVLTRVLAVDYDLVRARDGEEALAILRQQARQIDLVLSDKAMPRMSGVELLEETKALNPDIMRVILTGYPDAADLAEAINRGEVYRYVTKPFSPDELRLVVAQALERYQLARDNAELIAELKHKNGELKAVATRIADSFLHRLGSLALGSMPVEGTSARVIAVRDLLVAGAVPTISRAARAMSAALVRVRRRAAELRERDESGPHVVEFFDIAARECLVEAERILSVVAEIDELSRPDRMVSPPEGTSRAQRDDED